MPQATQADGWMCVRERPTHDGARCGFVHPAAASQRHMRAHMRCDGRVYSASASRSTWAVRGARAAWLPLRLPEMRIFLRAVRSVDVYPLARDRALRSCGDECVRISFIVLRDGFISVRFTRPKRERRSAQSFKKTQTSKDEQKPNGVTSVGD